LGYHYRVRASVTDQWVKNLKLMLLGALGFWMPDTLLHAWRGFNFGRGDVIAVTITTPVTPLATFFFARWLGKGSGRRLVPPLIAGVWLFGGLFMMAGASFSGGGFASPQGTRWALMTTLLSILPIYTFILATYDGALGALLLVTAAAAIAGAVRKKI
jgi:hypothetical protein